MRYEAIDSLYLAVPDMAAASSYGRIGVLVTSISQYRAMLQVGDMAVHILGEGAGDDPLIAPARAALQSGRTLFAVGLRVSSLSKPLEELKLRGIEAKSTMDRGKDRLWLPLHREAGADFVLIERVNTPTNNPRQTFPLKRLDHLAIVTHGLEEKTRYWTDVLGIPVIGEVTTPTLVIRQMRIGDAIVELLGPASPESPLHQRPAGLVSMASWEVTNMQSAVQQARDAGFTVPDPAPGPLPGTRITTIPGAELAGVNMQLLEYV